MTQLPICWTPDEQTDTELAQIRDRYQRQFPDEAAEPLLDRLRSLRPSS